MPQKRKEDKYMYIFIYIMVYVLVLFLSLHAAVIMQRDGVTLLDGFLTAIVTLQSDPLGFLPITFASLKVVGGLTVVFVLLGMYLWFELEKDAKRLKKDQKGSAEWYSDFKKYNKQYTDPQGKVENNGPNNMILSNDVFLSMDTRQTLRNNNILVIGGSGSGKSRFFVKPNLLQANCSYIITDPSGELLTSQGKFLEEQGYKIKVFNLVDMEHSNCYNPFHYIRDDLGVLMLVNCLIKNTTPPGKGGGDPFWEKSETALLQALIFYLIKYRPKEEQNFTSVMKLLRAAEVDENNPNSKSPLDRLFDDVQRNDPKSIALKQYMTFKMGAGKTLKSILISCSVRLTVFNMKQIENLTGRDDIELGKLGDEKEALFVVIPAADDTYNFLVSMMYSQLFETLYYHAENTCPKGYCLQKDGDKRFILDEKEADEFISKNPGWEKKKGDKRLANHCRFMLDEFANIGQIPDFDKKLATMRKYEISCSIILQNLAQIKEMYDKKAEGLIGNCDTIIFLGSSEFETCEYISKKLGKASVILRNNSRSLGSKSSSSLSYNHDARDLMTPDEVSRMDNKECIIFIRGLQAFKTQKYNYPKHPNYKKTGDAEIKNIYDYESKFNNSLSSLESAMKNLTKKKQTNIQKIAKVNEAVEGIASPAVMEEKQKEDIPMLKKSNEEYHIQKVSKPKDENKEQIEKNKDASEDKKGPSPVINKSSSETKQKQYKPQKPRSNYKSNNNLKNKKTDTDDSNKEEWYF